MKLIIDRFLKHLHNLPEQQKMLVSIGYSHDMIVKHFEIILDKYSLTPPQYNVLRILEGKHPNPCTASELRDMIIDRQCDVSRIVERLRVKGLIDRRVKAGDRRAVEIVITDAGMDIIKSITTEEGEKMFSPFYHITEDEAKQLNTLLQKLLEGMKVVKIPD